MESSFLVFNSGSVFSGFRKFTAEEALVASLDEPYGLLDKLLSQGRLFRIYGSRRDIRE